jgi:hypothetical protein
MGILAIPGRKNTKASFFAVVAILVILLGTLTAQEARANTLNFTPAGTPSITGTTTVGQTLAAQTGTWSPTPTSFTYQWQRNGSAIANATSSSYQIVGADFGPYITVTVTASRTGYITTARTSAAQAVFISTRANLSIPPLPTLTGTMQVGEWVTLVSTGWENDLTFTYQWFADSSSIIGATGVYLQIPAEARGKRLTVAVTGSKVGFNPRTVTSASGEVVKQSLPVISWSNIKDGLMGKNILTLSSTTAFGSSARIQTWCFSLNGSPVSWPSGSRGVYFVQPLSGQEIFSFSSGSGCFTSSSNIQNARIAIDVTNWRLGSNEITAVTTDSAGVSSNKVSAVFTVARTGPSVSLTSYPSVVSEVFRITGLAASHAPEALVKQWCVQVDGIPVSAISRFDFKSTTGLVQQASLNPSGNAPGCLVAPDGDLSRASIDIDSRAFSNGIHKLELRARSSDGESTWLSDPFSISFTSKNTYIPTLTWSESNKAVAREGSASRVAGSVVGNIPGPPPSIGVFAQDSSGNWKSIGTVKNSFSFDASSVFSANTRVRAVVFDEKGAELLSQESEVLVSMRVSLAKPRIVITGSTISDAKRKSVTVSVTSTKGRNATCSARWAGGSTNFTLKNGAGVVKFSPRGSGTLSVTCVADGMEQSRAVTVRY